MLLVASRGGNACGNGGQRNCSGCACRCARPCCPLSTLGYVQVQVLRLRDAATAVGVSRQALSARLKRGNLLTDPTPGPGDATNPEVLVVAGAVVKDLAHAADLIRGLAERVEELSPGAAESDPLSPQAKIRQLEQDLQLARHDLELERDRAAADSLAMVAALQSVSRHVKDRFPAR